LTTSFSCALTAARTAAAHQHYPQGTLYVVATPIGNLADITLRALHVLQLVDAIACEDTRHTQTLLHAYGIDKAPHQLIAVHQYNEAQAAQHIVERLERGARIAYVSDAGTPCISDPGARLVAATHAAGLRCIPLPGASSITCAISVAGVIGANSAHNSSFIFAGFLPAKGSERTAAIQHLANENRCTVLLEAPHRITSLARELAAVLDARFITLARELTKQFEEIVTCYANALETWLTSHTQRPRGEFVIIVHPVTTPHSVGDDVAQGQKLLRLLLPELPLKTAVRLAADISQKPRNALYQQALALKEEMSKPY